MIRWAAGILVLVNLAAFILMGVDKRRAIKGSWRIPERTLLAVCGAFAAAGGLIGMHVFHHKTRTPRFSLGVPVMLVLQAVLLYGLLRLI